MNESDEQYYERFARDPRAYRRHLAEACNDAAESAPVEKPAPKTFTRRKP